MIDDLIAARDFDPADVAPTSLDAVLQGDISALARMITLASRIWSIPVASTTASARGSRMG